MRPRRPRVRRARLRRRARRPPRRARLRRPAPRRLPRPRRKKRRSSGLTARGFDRLVQLSPHPLVGRDRASLSEVLQGPRGISPRLERVPRLPVTLGHAVRIFGRRELQRTLPLLDRPRALAVRLEGLAPRPVVVEEPEAKVVDVGLDAILGPRRRGFQLLLELTQLTQSR